MLAISPTQSNVVQALGLFLQSVMPAVAADGSAVSVLVGQQNRAAEPAGTTFAVMTPVWFERLWTNVDGAADVKFSGSISGAVMTVSAVQAGSIAAGATVFGPGVAFGTAVGAQASGTPGGAGAYAVSPAQTVAPGTLSAGAKTLTQGAKVTVQVDFHSADSTAGDIAQTVSTALRDEFGVAFFAALAPPLNGVVPLYADDPRQTPFINSEQQYEWRWVIEVCLQVDQTVTVPQTYSDSATVDVVDVSAAYPA